MLNQSKLRITGMLALLLPSVCAGEGYYDSIKEEQQSHTESKFAETWWCKDYVKRDNYILTAVVYEKGRLSSVQQKGKIWINDVDIDPDFQMIYRLDGIDRRWNWGLSSNSGYDYSFVVKPDGTGLYYSFRRKDTNVEPSEVFWCHR